MKRDLARLSNEIFDVVVIGGGIHGVCVAWDAALRGLSVALVERQDFGHATSANSLKIIHGGLRYVQDANLGRVRSMLEERSTWLRIAPHLVHGLPCLMPTLEQFFRSKAALSVALAINDLMAHGRLNLGDRQGRLPRGRILSRDECLSRLPGLDLPGVTGAALWHDAQIYDSERLLVAVLHSASEAGAAVANYVEATGFICQRGTVGGITALDALSGRALEVRGRVVVNCTGAWSETVLRTLDGPRAAPRFPLSYAVNLVTRQLQPDIAVGLPVRLANWEGASKGGDQSQVLFVVPWHDCSLVGTVHRPYHDAPEALQVPEALIESMLDAVNRVYPPAELRREDVRRVQAGFLPTMPGNSAVSRVKLLREGRVYEHPGSDRRGSVMTVVGVKYTTARRVAEKAVNRVVERLGRRAGPCQTQHMPVWGGQIDRFHDFKAAAVASRPAGMSAGMMEHLAHSYGSEYEQVLAYAKAEPSLGQPLTVSAPVLRAEVVHAVRAEMAYTLGDCVLRRTKLATGCVPEEAGLQACADVMAAELGWTPAHTQHEFASVRAALSTAVYNARAPFQVA